MKDIRLFNITRYKDILFKYPCVSPLSPYFRGTDVYVLDEQGSYASCLEGIIAKGGNVITISEASGADLCGDHAIGIIMPPAVKNEDSEEAYYHILDYYIHFAQHFVKRMKHCRGGFPHLIVVIPYGADRYSTRLSDMAFYAVTGMIGGLAREYGPQGIVVNGLMLGEQLRTDSVSHWLQFLASGNANNILGDIIKL